MVARHTTHEIAMAISAAAFKGKKSQILACEWGQLELWDHQPSEICSPLLELVGKIPVDRLDAQERELLEAFWPGPLFLRPGRGSYLCCPYEAKLRQSILEFSRPLYGRLLSNQFARFSPTLLTHREGWWSIEQPGFVTSQELTAALADPVVLSGAVDQSGWTVALRSYWLVGSSESVAHRMRKNLDQSGSQNTWVVLSYDCSQLFAALSSGIPFPGLHTVGTASDYAEQLQAQLPTILAEAKKSGVRQLFVQAPDEHTSLDSRFETVRVGAPENSV